MLMYTEDCGEDQSAGIQLPRLAASKFARMHAFVLLVPALDNKSAGSCQQALMQTD